MGRRRPLRWWPLLLAGLAGWAPPLAAGEHLRVVLDTSQSMRQTDPGGLARLATTLLFDLAQPDLALDDSFAVLPFHPTQHWTSPAAPPPALVGRRLEPRHGQREAFAGEVRQLAYDAAWTYFYPGLLAALAELEAIPGSRELRTIVIVTDGLPEKPTRDEELRRIRGELQPRLERLGIRLYVLAFGSQAHGERGFFEQLVRTPGGAVLGEVFVDRDGSGLVETMIRVFTHAFGYSQDAPQTLPAVGAIDLDGGTTSAKAAVVVYSPRPQPAPSLTLGAPPGAPHAPNLAGGVAGSFDRGASYALQWVLAPYPGGHPLTTDAVAGTVAVLRPTVLQLEVRSRSGGPLRAMARTAVPFGILLRSSGGAGPPAEAQISFRPNGPRTGYDTLGKAIYEWVGGLGAPPSGASGVVPEGRLFDAQVSFERDPQPAEPFYVGHLEVEARRGLALVGALQDARAERVEVFPRISIVAVPSIDSARIGGQAPRALGQGERGCARFELKLDDGRLPHPAQPAWPLRAVAGAATALSGPLDGAQLTLDGLPLEVAGAVPAAGQPVAAWSQGRPLSRAELLGAHEICLKLGRPSQPADEVVKLPLEFTLLESPYDEFAVVESFRLEALVSRITVFQRWRALGLLGAFLLAALLGLWYLRDRPQLPADLRFALTAASPAPAEEAMALRELPRGPFWRRLLGLAEERPLALAGEQVGWLRPTRDDLFRLRPASHLTLRSRSVEDPSAAGAAIEVRRIYRLESAAGAFLLRVEYQP